MGVKERVEGEEEEKEGKGRERKERESRRGGGGRERERGKEKTRWRDTWRALEGHLDGASRGWRILKYGSLSFL